MNELLMLEIPIEMCKKGKTIYYLIEIYFAFKYKYNMFLKACQLVHSFKVKNTLGTERAIENGLRYLHEQISFNTNKPYVLAIITYALHVCDSQRKGAAFSQLDTLAIKNGNTFLVNTSSFTRFAMCIN